VFQRFLLLIENSHRKIVQSCYHHLALVFGVDGGMPSELAVVALTEASSQMQPRRMS
jgi:hypothetical protein